MMTTQINSLNSLCPSDSLWLHPNDERIQSWGEWCAESENFSIRNDYMDLREVYEDEDGNFLEYTDKEIEDELLVVHPADMFLVCPITGIKVSWENWVSDMHADLHSPMYYALYDLKEPEEEEPEEEEEAAISDSHIQAILRDHGDDLIKLFVEDMLESAVAEDALDADTDPGDGGHETAETWYNNDPKSCIRSSSENCDYAPFGISRSEFIAALKQLPLHLAFDDGQLSHSCFPKGTFP